MKYYASIKAAHSALCLDIGFDPFLHGAGKPSARALADLGYAVDARRANQQAAEHAAQQRRREDDRRACEAQQAASEQESRRLDTALASAHGAVIAAFPALAGRRLDIIGNEDYSFARFDAGAGFPVVDFYRGEVQLARLVRNAPWMQEAAR